MRFLALAIVCALTLAAVSAIPSRILKAPKNLHVQRLQPHKANGRLSVEFNELFDLLIDRISSFVVSSGLDPMPLPDEGVEFTFTDLLGIEYTSELSLKKGWLTDLSTFKRDGDAKVAYVNSTLHVFSVGLVFPTISAAYDYTVKLLGIGPQGSINAKAVDLQVWVEVNIDVETSQLSLGQYTITDAGKLDVELQGGTIVDWIASAVINVFTWLFQGVILDFVEATVRPVLTDGLSQLTVQDVLEAAGVTQ